MDDFLGSGGQSVLILENWMGIAHSVDLGEDHGPPLSEPLRKLLKERKVACVFAAGTENGAERLRDKANELELLDPTVFIGRDSKLLPRAFGDGVIQDLSREAEFKAACEGIGRQLLDDGDPKHNSQWITEKVLGYGNDGFLVLTPYNVPTATLTCLGAEGKVNGSPWLPLIPRRKKN